MSPIISPVTPKSNPNAQLTKIIATVSIVALVLGLVGGITFSMLTIGLSSEIPPTYIDGSDFQPLLQFLGIFTGFALIILIPIAVGIGFVLPLWFFYGVAMVCDLIYRNLKRPKK